MAVVAVAVIIASACHSRSCIAAFCAGSAVIIKKQRRLSKRDWRFLSAATVLMISFLYFMRPDSANGRLLIWRVCLDMIADRPMGLGMNGMLGNYMLYQAAYFESHPASLFTRYADDVTIAYNEFLHIAVCFGILGLTIFCLAMADVMWTEPDNGKNDTMKAMLCSWLTFAMLSFPFSNMYTWVLFWALILGLRKRHGRKLMNITSTVLLVVGTGYFVTRSSLERSLDNGTADIVSLAESSLTLKVFPTIAYALLTSNQTSTDKCQEELIDLAMGVIPNSQVYCIKGDALLERGMVA